VIEIKGDPLPTQGIEEKLVKMLREYKMLDQVMAISFHHGSGQRVKELEPKANDGHPLHWTICGYDWRGEGGACRFSAPAWSYWTAELVAQVHAAGLARAVGLLMRALMEYVVPMGWIRSDAIFPIGCCLRRSCRSRQAQLIFLRKEARMAVQVAKWRSKTAAWNLTERKREYIAFLLFILPTW